MEIMELIWMGAQHGRTDVAVQVLNGNISAQAFARELRATAAVLHPNVARTFGAVTQEHPKALVMELCAGGTLQDVLDATRPEIGSEPAGSAGPGRAGGAVAGGRRDGGHPRARHAARRPQDGQRDDGRGPQDLSGARCGVSVGCQGDRLWAVTHARGRPGHRYDTEFTVMGLSCMQPSVPPNLSASLV